MKRIFKRIGAYLIDIIIISTIVTLLTSVDKINFQYKNYQKYYNEYTKITEKYTKTLSKQVNLEKKYKDKDVKKKEYTKKNNKYKNDIKSYEKSVKKIQYHISRNSIIYYIIYVAFALGYFGIFQASYNGQTIGKKLMHLKVVSKDDQPAKMWQFLLRTFILLNLWMYIANIILVYTLGVKTFYTSSLIISEVARGLQLVTLLLIVMSKQARGLHDYAALTKVVSCDDNENNDVEESKVVKAKKAEVVEAEIIEKKKKKKGGK